MNLQKALLPDTSVEILNYHDNEIYYRKKDSYVNATMMCQIANKAVSEWLRYTATQEYIKTIENETGLTDLVQIGLGSPRNGGGYWIHPKLVLALAEWLNNQNFFNWCAYYLDISEIELSAV